MTKNTRKNYSCDFETTTDPNDCRVWAYGWMEIGNKSNYKIGNDMDEFMDWVRKVNGNLYFHNVRFDGEFILNYLMHKGFTYSENGEPKTFKTTISLMGAWYMIDICYGYTTPKNKKTKPKKIHTVIYDSLKKLPFPVKVIGKAFNLNVLKIEQEKEFYERYRPVGHKITEEEYAYIKNDIEVIADALEVQFRQGMTSITAGSDSLNGFKDVITRKNFEKLFPVLTNEEDKEIRLAYRGGFTWLKDDFVEQTVGEGIVFDVNSLYPAQMYYRPLPYGKPIKFAGKYEYDKKYPLHVQHLRCEFTIKDDKIPTIQLKKNRLFKQNEYLKSSNNEIVDLYMTNVDLDLFYEHYEVYNEQYVGGWKFKERVGIFKGFIDKWMHIKTTTEGALKQLAKLQLNSLYGKFATNPDVTGKIPYLKEDGSCGYRDGDKEERDPVYTPMGIFITSWARYTTITTAQKCYDRIIYCDTDSIHLTGTSIPDAIKDIVDNDKLGYWAWEGTFKRGKFLRQKTYVEDYYINDKGKMCSQEEATGTKFKVVCSGMPDEVKNQVTFDNFKMGFTSEKGKLRPKHVKGGVVLVDTPFTLKGEKVDGKGMDRRGRKNVS